MYCIPKLAERMTWKDWKLAYRKRFMELTGSSGAMAAQRAKSDKFLWQVGYDPVFCAEFQTDHYPGYDYSRFGC